jgi:hypothetical protein
MHHEGHGEAKPQLKGKEEITTKDTKNTKEKKLALPHGGKRRRAFLRDLRALRGWTVLLLTFNNLFEKKE